VFAKVNRTSIGQADRLSHPDKRGRPFGRPLAFQTVKQAGCSSTDQELRKQRSPLFFHCHVIRCGAAKIEKQLA
jgi:hypothetical protein